MNNNTANNESGTIKANLLTKKTSRILGQILLFIVVAIATVPLVWTVFLSLKTNNDILINPLGWPEKIQWINYSEAIMKIPFFSMVSNTAIVLAVTLPACILFSVLAAFAISRMKFGSGRLQNGVYSYFVAGVIMPTFVLLFPVYLIMNRMGLHDTLWSVILPHIGWTVPLNMMILVNSFKSVPDSIEEAAFMDGCSVWKMLLKIFIPMMKSSISTVFIFNFLSVWNDFPLARVMLINPGLRTISLAASYFKGQYSDNYALMTAGVVILTIPQLAIFAFFQKYIIEGVATGAVKG